MKKIEIISEQTKPYLIKLQDEIASSNFDSVYDYLNLNVPTISRETVIPEITHIFYSSGIDPLINMKRIPEYFLSNCDDITEFNIPSNIIGIGKYAFNDCNLKEIKIPSSVTYIGANAFLWDGELKDIYLSDPTHKLYLDVSSFGACTNLENIYFNGSKDEFEAVIKRSLPFTDFEKAMNIIFGSKIGLKIIKGEIKVHYTK